MPTVLDTSVAAAWALFETEQAAAEIALDEIRKNSAIVPALFWFELRNTLIINERRGRITQQDSSDFLSLLSNLAVSVDNKPDERHVMNLARHHVLTVYDASYLELALRMQFPLATLGRKLKDAAIKLNVAIIGA